LDSLVFSTKIIDLIINQKINKFLKKASIKQCPLCKGLGFFRGLKVGCSKCNKSGYLGSGVKLNNIYQCKINRKDICYFAEIKITGVTVVNSNDIIFGEYGFNSQVLLDNFIKDKNQLWSIGFLLMEVTDYEKLEIMQRHDHRVVLNLKRKRR